MRPALLLGLTFLCLVIASNLAPALAQIRETCATLPETIVTLRKTPPGRGGLWDAAYGQRGMERFETAVFLENGNILAAGALYDRAEPQDRRALIVDLDRRGKVIRQNRHPGLGNISIRKVILKEKGGFLAAGTKILPPADGHGPDRQVVRLAHYGPDLKVLSEYLLEDPAYDLTLEGLTVSADGGALVAAVSARGRGSTSAEGERGVVYLLTPQAKVIWKRSYDPGLGNRFTNIVTTADSLGNPGYVLTGTVRDTDRRAVGFALKLDADGRLIWQKQYPRGAGATLRSAASYGTGDIVVAGDSDPYGEKKLRSAWVMRLNGNTGEPVWQRYLSVAGAKLYGRDIVAVADGRAAVLIDSENSSGTFPPTGPDMARLVTFSPRGEIMDDEGFAQGSGAHGNALVLGPKRLRIIAGHATMTPKGDDKSKLANYDTEDGWIVVASSLEPYTDPCGPQRAAVGDDE